MNLNFDQLWDYSIRNNPTMTLKASYKAFELLIEAQMVFELEGDLYGTDFLDNAIVTLVESTFNMPWGKVKNILKEGK